LTSVVSFHILRLVVLATTVAVLATACAPSQSSQGGSQATSQAPASSPAGPKTITVGVSGTIEALSIMGSSTTSGGWQSLNELHSQGLITADRDIQRPVPRLATEVPTFDNGGIELLPDGRMKTTYKLRNDVKWQDGTPFTAQDMAFAFELNSDKNMPFLNRDAIQEMQSAEAPDDYTFVIYWRGPYYQADSMGLRAMWPHPRHILEQPYRTLDKQAFINLPYWTSEYVHLGPYRLTNYLPGEQLVFTASEGYFLGRPKLDRVIVRVFNDNNTLYAAVLSGSVDMLMDNSWSPTRG